METTLRTLHSGPALGRACAPLWDGRSFWVVVFESGFSDPPRPVGLWRSDDEGASFVLVCAGADVLPNAVQPMAVTLVATAPGEVHLLTEGPKETAYHAAFDGKRFVAQPSPPFPFDHACRNAVAVDPERRTILVACRAELALYEHARGAWRKVGTLESPDNYKYYFRAAMTWDAVRKAIVIVHKGNDVNAMSDALTWDGKTLSKLPASPIKPTVSEDNVVGVPHPSTGRALFLGQGFSGWTLGKTKFEPLPDPGAALGRHTHVSTGPYGIVLWNRDRQCWDGKKWTTIANPFDGWRGELDGSSVYTGTEKHPKRTEVACAWDAESERLIVAGGLQQPFLKMTPARDTWEWTKKQGWKELKTKGRPLARCGGLATFARGTMIVTAGSKATRDRDPIGTTEELANGRWEAFPDSFRGGARPSELRTIAADPKSGAVFGVSVDASDVHVWAYSGGGRWSHGLVLTAEGKPGLEDVKFAFDARGRRLLAKGNLKDVAATAAILGASLGEWLDSLPSRSAAKAAPTAKPAAPPSAPERYLVYREAGLGKYWFATLAGKKWTAKWGKRGSTGQSKASTFPTPEKARADFEKTVRKKLDEGYVDSERGASIATIAQRPAFTLAVTKKPSGIDRIGGPSPTASPKCKGCGKPMELVATFAADAERLPLDGKALAIFMCEGVGDRCKTWDPNAGANAALLLPKAPTAVSEGQGARFTRTMEMDRKAEGLEAESPGGSKLGGYPTWMQDPEPPTCAKCKAPMRFALQLDADDVGANFGDSGIGYAFTCPHGAKFLWQGA